jgi:hypothetical protein
MVERLVDVLNSNKHVLHTYVVEVGEPIASKNDVAFSDKALTAAVFDQLVPDPSSDALQARMHVSRGGRLAPFGDERGPLAETRHGLNEVARQLAYSLWEQDGCPGGCADEYWHHAREQHLRERAYVLWQHEGSPEGRADEYWFRTCQFEGG